MNSVLLWIGGVLIAVLALMFAMPYVVDWNSWRGEFEEEASRLMQRDVRVGGAVNLRLLPVPYVRFEKVRISDADATLGEPFFRADALTMWLSITPLLHGAVEAHRIEVDGPVLRLAVDGQGRGNWQALRVNTAALPSVLTEVAFQELRIRNGTVSLKTPSSPETTTLSGIDGELSATALAGPYTFVGSLAWNGEPRQVRLATAPQEADGRVRVKASVTAPASGNTYVFDGNTSELTPRAKIAGTLTARLPIAGKSTGAGAKPGEPAGRAAPPDAFELKAEVAGDLDAVKLSDIAAIYEQEGKPQMMTGEASADWRNGPLYKIALASRWLDLDALAPVGKAPPPAVAHKLLESVGLLLPQAGTTYLTLDVDQINLGGEPVSGLRLALVRTGNRTSIGELKAGLPGNARAGVRGVHGGAGDPTAFEGEIVLHGTSLQRFAAWANQAPGDGGVGQVVRTDRPFSLASQLKLSSGSVELSGANAELGETQLQGNVAWRWQGVKSLTIGVEGASLDISALAPGLLDLDAWLGRGKPADGAADGVAPPASALGPLGGAVRAVSDGVGGMKIRVRTQELVEGPRRLRDVDAELGIENSGSLSIQSLRFSTASGVGLDLQGELKAVDTRPAGEIRGWIAAHSAEALHSLSAALPGGTLPADWQSRMGRLDLGFTAQLGEGTAGASLIRADGTIDGGRIDLAARLAGGLLDWRKAPIDLTLQLEGADVGRLVQTGGGSGKPGDQRSASGLGHLVLKSAGASAAELTTWARLELDRLGMTYSGRSGLAADGRLDLDGELELTAADAGDVLHLIGSGSRTPNSGASVQGSLKLTRRDGRTVLETRSLSVGGTRVAGTVSLAGDNGGTRIDGKLNAGRVTLAALLGPALEQAGPAAAPADAGGASPWPDVALGPGVLDGMTGRIELSTPAFEIARGVQIANARMTAEVSPGRIAITQLDGEALGGKLTSRSTISRAPGAPGADLTVEADLANAKLALMAGAGGESRPGGEVNVKLKVAARAASLRAAIATLSGGGEAEISGGHARGVAAGAIDAAAGKLLEADGTISREALEQELRAGLGSGDVALGNRKLTLEVVDGAIRVSPLQIETADAVMRNVTTIDLSELKGDSEWRITPRRSTQPKKGGPSKPPLPAVSLVWSGPLAGLAAAPPRLQADALERELGVRKMERDVERLEEVRRKDEERARAEAERLRSIDESAQGPGAGGSTQPPVIIAPFPVRPMPPQVPGATPAPQLRREGSLEKQPATAPN